MKTKVIITSFYLSRIEKVPIALDSLIKAKASFSFKTTNHVLEFEYHSDGIAYEYSTLVHAKYAMKGHRMVHTYTIYVKVSEGSLYFSTATVSPNYLMIGLDEYQIFFDNFVTELLLEISPVTHFSSLNDE